MTKRDDRATTNPGPAGTTHIAWLVCFGVPLVLLVLMCLAMPARGASTPQVETTITSGPGEGSTIEEGQPILGFDAAVNPPSGSPAAFYCSIDGAAPAPCAPPHQVEPLDDGAHTFSVYAQDTGSGAVDPTPAIRGFHVNSGESEEGEEDACFEEFAEGEEDAEEGEEEGEGCEDFGSGRYPPPACLLRTANARVFAYTAQDKVRLTIRYTSRKAASVIVSYRLTGRKGSLSLGKERQRFAKRGLFQATAEPNESQMERVLAAKGFSVKMRIPAAPRFCDRYYSRHLTIRRAAKRQISWLQTDSIFGT
ncbi:MAG: hypothetical protein WD810_09375 [Solirubrobacterales bacterium]